MKSNAPWSVKGIAKDTRETAKEAARKEGMTVGEWLNTVIHQARNEESQSGGEISGIQVNDIVSAIEQLSHKIGSQEQKTERSVEHLSRNLRGIIDRIQTLETTAKNQSDTNRVDNSGNRDFEESLVKRLAILEQKTSDNQRIDALRALEKAVGQVAAQFDTAQKATVARIEANETDLSDLGMQLAKIDANIVTLTEQNTQSQPAPQLNEELSASISALDNRLGSLEGSQNTGAITDPDFAERTGKRLRVLGDEIKRSGDQVRSLETLISRLADQIDAAEQRSSDGVQKVTETITTLSEKFSEAQKNQKESSQASTLDQAFLTKEIAKAVNSSNQDLENRIAFIQDTIDTRFNQVQENTPQTASPIISVIDPSQEKTAHDQSHKELAPQTSPSIDALGLEGQEDNREANLGIDTQNIAHSEAADPKTALDQPDTALDQPVASASATGSLYEDDQEEELVEDNFDNIFDDFALDDDTEDKTPHQEDSITAQSDESEFEPIAHANHLSEFCGNQDTHQTDANFDTEQISAEINEILNGSAPQRSTQPHVEPVKDAAKRMPEAQQSEAFDDYIDDIGPFPATEETIARPRASAPSSPAPHRTTQELNPVFDDEFSSSPDHGNFDQPTHTGDLAKSNPAPASVETTQEHIAAPRQKPAPTQTAGKLPRTAEGKIDVARLTPKQKAILAARAQKKRQEAAAQARHARSQYQSYDERNEIQDEGTSVLSKVTSLFKRGPKNDDAFDREQVPQSKKKIPTPSPQIDDADRATDFRAAKRRDKAARYVEGNFLFRNGKPTKVFLTIAGILLLCLIFLVAKPFLNKPQPTRSRQTSRTLSTTPSAVKNVPGPALTEPNSSSETQIPPVKPLLEAPSVDGEAVVRPRQLFLESMAILEGGEDGPGAEAAFNNIQKSASLGYPPAQFQLGEFYKNGLHTEQNAGRARTWFQRAASGGNVYAMHRLGYLFAEGEGGSADITTAIEFFEQAANFGFVDSQYNLGAIFDPGAGNDPQGIQNVEKAYKWYALAALNGDNQAGNKAADIASRLSSAQKVNLDQEIASWRAQPVNVSANENLSN